MSVRETEERRARIQKYLLKAKVRVSDVYRMVNADIIKYKGIPPYLKEGK